MKYYIVLLVIVLLSCKSQMNQQSVTEKNGYALPAFQLEKSMEQSLNNSIRNSEIKVPIINYEKVMIDNKEYSVSEYLNVLPTLDSTAYTFYIKNDSLASEKVLVVTTKRKK